LDEEWHHKSGDVAIKEFGNDLPKSIKRALEIVNQEELKAISVAFDMLGEVANESKASNRWRCGVMVISRDCTHTGGIE